jgi:hypothetical protein
MTGPQGGPFSNPTFDIVLDNPGSDPVSWSATSVPSFAQLDQLNGVIPPNGQAQVHASLIAGVAQAMLPGTYSETLTIHNDSASQPDIDIDATVIVLTANASSQLVPSTNFSSQGPAAGPFVPDGTTYSLTNTGNVNLSWQAGALDVWVTVSPNSGQLTPGNSVDLLVSINDPATASLSIGVHATTVQILDASDSSVIHSRDVSLNIMSGSSSSGWTAFAPSSDTRIVYVSSSGGNDSNNGLSDTTPKRTIAGGKSLLRNGFPDWLLLKCGDSWSESLNTSGEFHLSGRSLQERMLVSSYGTGARPLLRTGTGNGVDNFATGNHDVAIVGLHFWADTYNGSQGTNRGVQWLGTSSNFLLEDCYVQAYETNVVVMGTSGRNTNAAIRRNVIVDAYNTLNTNSQGLYADATDGLLIEENVFDHNGWRDDVPGSGPTWFRHNVYIQNGPTGVVFRGNILAGTDGLQGRPGGICDDNLFMRNAISLQFGSGNFPEAGGVSGTIHNNVVLDGGDLQAGSPRGWGLIIGNTVNTTVDHNIVAHNVTGTSPNPWVLNFDNGHGNPNGMQNVNFDHNVVYDWSSLGRGAQVATYQNNIMLNITFNANDINDGLDTTYLASLGSTTPNFLSQIHSSNNHWYRASGDANQVFQLGGNGMSFGAFNSALGDSTSTWGAVAYPDPNRTIGTYHASIGGAPSLQAFMAEARNQSKTNWRIPYTADAVNTYIRAGFGL